MSDIHPQKSAALLKNAVYIQYLKGEGVEGGGVVFFGCKNLRLYPFLWWFLGNAYLKKFWKTSQLIKMMCIGVYFDIILF